MQRLSGSFLLPGVDVAIRAGVECYPTLSVAVNYKKTARAYLFNAHEYQENAVYSMNIDLGQKSILSRL
ncbi:hypothetical protein [Kistimonas asteriae]|uniref:hypothetical protein n=1 Tax=Kistimonas asteriae TaxID=517724 RepID=UPI001BA72314|nr:hypothetical protein [Kistimonas asteriae]